ncbi:mitochondrial basic amino acids transporter-like [Paramacrobiotus metropolitanus]|uniref:mitochondrial basic amino acids transporter-like n=1 Tax=Paramacrobiotus metropolitanus TaxID=2943436 RepID=UPI002445FEA5|nr:mitochondrial basic amino acids transporter-like [Paramacrobiotus metropolitanus]
MNPQMGEFVGGCVSGAAQIVSGHPLDTVKVRLQTQPATRPLYTGTLHCFVKMVRSEGVAGLYKGMSSPLHGVVAVNALIFGVQGNVLRLLPGGGDSLANQSLAGMVAGAAQSLLACPLELAKTRMQVQGITDTSGQPLHRSPTQYLRQVYRAHGLRAVYRGFNVTLLRDIPGFGAYFLPYEYLRRLLTPAGGHPDDLSVPWLMLAGGLAGSISWLASFPQDVVKTRFQMDDPARPRFRSATHCALESARQEKLRVFARGLCPLLLRGFLTNAIILPVNTLFRRYVIKDDSRQPE